MWSNKIPGFPFRTVFDFISEIKRPPDDAVMANLRYSFKVADFKYDLTSKKAKGNPQEILDGINSQLTRLQVRVVIVVALAVVAVLLLLLSLLVLTSEPAQRTRPHVQL
jgi:hypothetical protein